MKRLYIQKYALLYLILLATTTTILSQTAQRFGPWENIESFDISDEEDYIVFTRLVNGRTILYESTKVVFGWTEASPISNINDYNQETANIGGPFLSLDSKRLYFHANYSDSEGGYDIYYSKRTPDGWSEPINIGSTINNTASQYYPSVTPGRDRIYFSEGFNTEYEYKKPKTSPECQRIKTAIKQPNNKWCNPYYIHQVVNSGCEYAPVIAPDGKTIYFSSIDPEDHKLGYKLVVASERGKEIWTMPNFIETHEDLEGDKLNPRITTENIFFIRHYKEKKEIKKHLYIKPLNKETLPFETITSKGKISTKISDTPIEADIVVYNPTTLSILSQYKSDKHTGEFELCLLDKKNYLVEIRKFGYSFASFMVNYKTEQKQNIPELIQLFDTIELSLSVFDREIFSPLKVSATAIDTENKKNTYEGVMTNKGVYSFKLPLGSNYNIQAFADWFDLNEFLFKLEGDIVFNKFNRNLPLTPQKNIFSIVTMDAESGVVFVAEGFLVNLTSDEPPIFFSIDDVDEDGNVKVNLRKGDKYELTMNSEGYFFHSQVIDMQEDQTDDSTTNLAALGEGEFALEIKMDSLRADKAITLDNITFDNNSASLATETFNELNKVVDVIINNPKIFIEISAHTDNIGSTTYNKLLSNKRSQSVVNYLLENEVPMERIVSKGYGFEQPKVPNDSDENRAINRRVEFKVISEEDMLEAMKN